jgi:hypothetical protein
MAHQESAMDGLFLPKWPIFSLGALLGLVI